MGNPPVYPILTAWQITCVLAYIRARRLSAGFYTGYADEGLIRTLKAVPNFELAIMDYYSRWNVETRGVAADEGVELAPDDCPVPDWILDVPCYSEGHPRVPLLIADLPVHLDELLPHPCWHHVVLLGEAARASLPVGFSWRWTDWACLGCRVHPPASPAS